MPFELRARLAYDGKLLGAVARIFADSVLGFYRRRTRDAEGVVGRSGAVTVVQRTNADLRLNPHFHGIFLDGVFAVRNLVGLRLDGPGMRWGRDRSELVLHLRCILPSGKWRDFAAYLTRLHLPLAAAPAPARTHDAKPQKPQQLREAA